MSYHISYHILFSEITHVTVLAIVEQHYHPKIYKVSEQKTNKEKDIG